MLLTTNVPIISNSLKKSFVFRYSTLSGQKNKNNSIIPLVDKILTTQRISNRYYSKRHWKQIKDASKHIDQSIRVISYNILWDLFEEKRTTEYLWKNRYERVAQTMLDGNADIIGLQEDREHLIGDLSPFYEKTYERVGDSGSSGECCSLLFKKARFDLVSSGRITLSSSKPRHLTCLKVRDKTTENVINIFNTHLNFTSLETRHEQAHNLKGYMQQNLEAGNSTILLGDFNTFPNRPDLLKNTPLDGDEIERLIEESGLVNTMRRAIFGCVGPRSSYNNCEKTQILEGRCIPFAGLGVPGVFLDHIYTCRKIRVLIHGVNPVLVDGLFGSDHMPVICNLL